MMAVIDAWSGQFVRVASVFAVRVVCVATENERVELYLFLTFYRFKIGRRLC